MPSLVQCATGSRISDPNPRREQRGITVLVQFKMTPGSSQNEGNERLMWNNQESRSDLRVLAEASAIIDWDY